MTYDETMNELRQASITRFAGNTPAIHALAKLLGPEVSDTFEDVALSSFNVTNEIASLNLLASTFPAGLQGVWYTPNHPKFGDLFLLFSGSDAFHGRVINIHGEQDYSFNDVVTWKLTHGVVADTPTNRRWLQFLHKYGLEYAFPLFTARNLRDVEQGRKLHHDTWVVNSMDKPFQNFFLPAAYSEGYSMDDYRHAGRNGSAWDPLASDDVVKCLCSLHYYSDDRIERTQFGRPAYTLYRIADGRQTTPWFSHFKEKLMRTRFVQIDRSSAENIGEHGPPLAKPHAQ